MMDMSNADDRVIKKKKNRKKKKQEGFLRRAMVVWVCVKGDEKVMSEDGSVCIYRRREKEREGNCVEIGVCIYLSRFGHGTR